MKNEILKVVPMKKIDRGIKEVLKSVIEDEESFEAIVILAMDKNERPHIFTSKSTFFELSYMKEFFSSWLQYQMMGEENE